MIDQIAIVWGVEDVFSVRPDLSKDQALRVLEQVKKLHDANIGVNWQFIGDIADTLYPV